MSQLFRAAEILTRQLVPSEDALILEWLSNVGASTPTKANLPKFPHNGD